jgi:hypothetical protein
LLFMILNVAVVCVFTQVMAHDLVKRLPQFT